jgi:hypothetical protein
MAEMWYYTRAGKQMEPVGTEELKRLAISGILEPTDLVWKDGMSQWARASSISELLSEDDSDAQAANPAPKVATPARGRQDSQDARLRRQPQPYLDHHDDEDDDLPRRRRYSRRPGMRTGTKVGLLLGGSFLGILVIAAILIAAVRSREQARAQAQLQRAMRARAQFQPGWRFRNVPPQVQPPTFKGPLDVGPQGLTLADRLNGMDSRMFIPGFEVPLICKVFTVNMTEGKTYTIRQESGQVDFDSFLILQDSNFVHLIEDDDSGVGVSGLDALITFPCQKTATYRIVAGSLHGRTGAFTLKITEK